MSRAALIAFVFGAGTVGVVVDARADEPADVALSASRATCDASFETAELRLRPADGRLLDARAALRACALPSCQPWMVDDCTKRLVEVDGRIPSVVFSAADERKIPLYDVEVLEGDRQLLDHLDGRGVEMDPGPHEMVARRGAARITLSIVVLEGRKAQHALFAFGDAPAPDAATPSTTPPPHDLDREAPLVHPWARPLAGALLLAGTAATAIGTGYGIDAIAKKKAAHCDAADVCDGPLEGARHSARAATVSLLLGGALVIGSVVTFLVLGRARAQATAWTRRMQNATTW